MTPARSGTDRATKVYRSSLVGIPTDTNASAIGGCTVGVSFGGLSIQPGLSKYLRFHPAPLAGERSPRLDVHVVRPLDVSLL